MKLIQAVFRLSILNILSLSIFIFNLCFTQSAIAAGKIGFTGLTVASKQELLESVAELKTKKPSLEQAKEAAKNIEKYLEEKGYFLSEVVLDEEKFAKGQVHFNVYEGFVHKIFLTNPEAINPKIAQQLMRYLEPITKHKPLHRDIYEKYVLLADEQAGIELEASLQRSDVVGAADTHVKINNFNRVDAFASVDNMLNQDNGPMQYIAGVILNTPDYKGQTTLFGAHSSKSKRFRVVSLGHSQNIGVDGLNLSGDASRTLAAPNPKASSSSNLSTNSYSLQGTYSLFSNLRSSLIFKTKLEALRSINKATDTTEDYQDRVRPLRLNVHYEFYDRWYAQNILEAEGSHGLKVMGASNSGDGRRSRTDAKSNFSKLTLSFHRNHYLPNNFALITHVKGQKGINKMLSSEEFDFGGDDVGRGYEGSALSGDSGASAKAELHYKHDFNKLLDQMDLYVFYDFGWATNKLNKISVDNVLRRRASASSTGFGINIVSKRFLTGSVVLGKPLTFPSKHNTRVTFKVMANMNHKR